MITVNLDITPKANKQDSVDPNFQVQLSNTKSPMNQLTMQTPMYGYQLDDSWRAINFPFQHN